MTQETIITNARLVLADEVVRGAVIFRDGTIAAIDLSCSRSPAALDFEGDLLLPGLVEIHTDNVEKHFVPRPGVLWPSSITALAAHDTQVAGAGITTVLDAVSVGQYRSDSRRNYILKETVKTIEHMRAAGLLRAEHRLHLRCEVTDPQVVELFEPLADHALVQLVSVMDHTPGQRQWTDIAKYKQYNKMESLSDQEVEKSLSESRDRQSRFGDAHRAAIVAMCRARDIPLASHDDTTEAHVDEAVRDGIAISEFPCSEAAARKARGHGLGIVMGAPNVVRGGSHSGNVSALALAENGLLDGLSSDYVPNSLLHAAFILHENLKMSLPAAVATVSRNPAELVGLTDRGEIAVGKRADMIRVSDVHDVPVVREAWRSGGRVL